MLAYYEIKKELEEIAGTWRPIPAPAVMSVEKVPRANREPTSPTESRSCATGDLALACAESHAAVNYECAAARVKQVAGDEASR